MLTDRRTEDLQVRLVEQSTIPTYSDEELDEGILDSDPCGPGLPGCALAAPPTSESIWPLGIRPFTMKGSSVLQYTFTCATRNVMWIDGGVHVFCTSMDASAFITCV